MAQIIISGLAIATGLLAIAVGFMIAREAFRAAVRTHQKTASLLATHPEGWSSWFLGGFSGVAMGMYWLAAAATWAALSSTGACLIGLGIRLFRR